MLMDNVLMSIMLCNVHFSAHHLRLSVLLAIFSSGPPNHMYCGTWHNSFRWQCLHWVHWLTIKDEVLLLNGNACISLDLVVWYLYLVSSPCKEFHADAQAWHTSFRWQCRHWVHGLTITDQVLLFNGNACISLDLVVWYLYLVSSPCKELHVDAQA